MSRSKGHDVLGMDMSHLLSEVESEIEHEKSDVTVGGSNALIDESKIPDKKQSKQSVGPSNGFVDLSTSKVDVWPFANRQSWEMNLDALVESISRNGQMQPVRVRKKGSRYELVYGRRRFEACKLLGIEIKTQVITASDSEAYAMQQMENDEREPVSAYSDAISHKKALSEGVFKSTSALAAALGKDRSTVSGIIHAYGDMPILLVQAIGDMRRVSVNTARYLNQALKEDSKRLGLLIDISSKLRAGQGKGAIDKAIGNLEDLAKANIVKVGGKAVFTVARSKRNRVSFVLENSEDHKSIKDLIVNFYKNKPYA